MQTQEAPDECGFPPGTALIFAGRSTTGRLQVQEMLGDPMSDDLADIYITRDEFDQGENRGRLVCAIYVDTPGFVEITLAPEGWDPETGRPPLSPSADPTETPIAEQPAAGLTREEAISAARAAAPEAAGWDVSFTRAGPAGEVLESFEGTDWVDAIPSDRWVWIVDLLQADEATLIVIDYVDGTVYGAMDFIVN